MKVSPKDRQKVLKGLKEAPLPLLAYGPDAGGVTDCIHEAIKHVTDGTSGDAATQVRIDGETLSKDPARLGDEACQPSFFGDMKIIRVGPVSDSHTATLAALDGSDLFAHVFIEAGNLGPRSKLRKQFESSKNAHIIACYHDTQRDIDRLIEEELLSKGIILERDAAQLLRSSLGADRGLSRAELQKIALFAGPDGGKVGFDDVEALLSGTANGDTNDYAASVFDGMLAQADHKLATTLQGDPSGIQTARAMAQRCIRLMTAQAARAEGKSMDDAIKGLKPPLFWKDKDSFIRQLQAWPLARLEVTLESIMAAEIALKTGGPNAQLTLSRLSLKIGTLARRNRAA